MNPRNRDLLVLTKRDNMNDSELEREIEVLNDLFYLVECSNAVCLANEIIDVNRYRIIRKAHAVRQALRERKLKPFVFISNSN